MKMANMDAIMDFMFTEPKTMEGVSRSYCIVEMMQGAEYFLILWDTVNSRLSRACWEPKFASAN